MRLFVGGQAWSIQGERDNLAGDRCWTAAHPCQAACSAPVACLLDSGAFSDSPECRLSPEAALERQLTWERRAAESLGAPFWQAEAIVSYDRLIGTAAADSAVRETVDNAAFLCSRREDLAPRKLVLACQGMESGQYAECASGILRHATPPDWFGLGGWCLLGRAKTLLPEFLRTCRIVLPLVAAAGLRHCHLFGVLWEPALGALLWLCDQLGLSASCDSAAPILACTRGDARKAGCRAKGWRANVAWWQARVAGLRQSPCYREPARELWL